MRSRSILTVLALAFAPLPLLAQFATVVAPPRRPRPPAVAERPRPEATPAAEEQRRQMLDIKAWVDSAAGALAGRPNAATAPGAPPPPTTPPTPPDSAARRTRPPVRPDTTRRPPGEVGGGKGEVRAGGK